MAVKKHSYFSKGKEYTYFEVYIGRKDGKDVWKRCKTLPEARQLERKYKNNHNDVEAALIGLTTPVKVEILRVIEGCMRLDVSLTHIYEYYLKHHATDESLTIYECAQRYMDELNASGRRENYKKTMRQWIAQFTDTLGYIKAPALNHNDIKNLYNKVLDRSKSTWKNRCSAFFSWMIRNNYLQENLAEKLQTPILDRKLPQVLTVEQCRILLAKCPAKILPGLILMLFGGIRPFEAKQITQPAISFDRRTITVDGSIAKTRSFRTVAMSNNTVAWFQYCEKHRMRLPITPALKQVTECFAAILDLKTWPRDCLRHTAASMMLMRDKSAEKVALELGNSPGVLHRHYKNLVSEEDCEEFWSLTPATVGRKSYRRY